MQAREENPTSSPMVVRRLDLEERVDLDNGDTWRDSSPPCIVCVASTKRIRLRSSRKLVVRSLSDGASLLEISAPNLVMITWKEPRRPRWPPQLHGEAQMLYQPRNRGQDLAGRTADCEVGTGTAAATMVCSKHMRDTPGRTHGGLRGWNRDGGSNNGCCYRPSPATCSAIVFGRGATPSRNYPKY